MYVLCTALGNRKKSFLTGQLMMGSTEFPECHGIWSNFTDFPEYPGIRSNTAKDY